MTVNHVSRSRFSKSCKRTRRTFGVTSRKTTGVYHGCETISEEGITETRTATLDETGFPVVFVKIVFEPCTTVQLRTGEL